MRLPVRILPNSIGMLLVWSAFLASPVSAQKNCNDKNMIGMWKLVSEVSVVDVAAPAPIAEYLELRSGQLFWVVQPADGVRTRERHKVYFSGSTLDIRPALAKAPSITRCTRSGSRLVMLTAAHGEDGSLRRGRLEFRKTGR